MSIIREAKKEKILVYYFKTYFLVLLISSLLFAAYSFSVLSAVCNDGWEKTQKELELSLIHICLYLISTR